MLRKAATRWADRWALISSLPVILRRYLTPAVNPRAKIIIRGPSPRTPQLARRVQRLVRSLVAILKNPLAEKVERPPPIAGLRQGSVPAAPGNLQPQQRHRQAE